MLILLALTVYNDAEKSRQRRRQERQMSFNSLTIIIIPTSTNFKLSPCLSTEKNKTNTPTFLSSLTYAPQKNPIKVCLN